MSAAAIVPLSIQALLKVSLPLLPTEGSDLNLRALNLVLVMVFAWPTGLGKM